MGSDSTVTGIGTAWFSTSHREQERWKGQGEKGEGKSYLLCTTDGLAVNSLWKKIYIASGQQENDWKRTAYIPPSDSSSAMLINAAKKTVTCPTAFAPNPVCSKNKFF